MMTDITIQDSILLCNALLVNISVRILTNAEDVRGAVWEA
jgi:hypothetical protein